MSHSFIQQSPTDDISYPNYFSLAFILVHGYVFILRKEIQLQSIFQFLWYKYSVTIFVKYFSNYRGSSHGPDRLELIILTLQAKKSITILIL